MRRCIAACLLLLAACGSDGGNAGRGFLDGWSEFPAGPDVEGHPTRVDEDQRVLYIEDCDAAERATATGGPFGPSERDPETQEFEPGYAYICASGD